MVVGEQTFLILSEVNGEIRYQRRLEFTPSCVKTFHVPGQNKDIYEAEDRTGSAVA